MPRRVLADVVVGDKAFAGDDESFGGTGQVGVGDGGAAHAAVAEPVRFVHVNNGYIRIQGGQGGQNHGGQGGQLTVSANSQFAGAESPRCRSRGISFVVWRNQLPERTLVRTRDQQEATMGRGILLWLLGVPIPVIILLALFFHH